VGGTSASQPLTAVAEWWLRVGTGGSDPPKLLSLLAFRELTAGEEGRWFGTWLSYEAAATSAPETLERWLSGVYRVSVEPSRDPLTGAVSFDAYFERSGERFKMYTDFTIFYLSCETRNDAAKDVLRAVAKALGIEKPNWEGNALVLPAEVGWPMFLKLWARRNMSLPIEKGGNEFLRVEVLDVKSNGEAKFRLWFHKWRETRPDRPYVDIEIEPYRDEGGVRFRGRIFANKAEGILREHLREIAEVLKGKGVDGVAYYEYEKKIYLYFTGAFRDSVLGKLGIEPELPPGEPPAVQHLGSLKFRVGNCEVELSPMAMGARRELYAVLMFPSREEAEDFVRSLKAVGVYAEVVGSEKAGYMVRLYRDSFLGLLAAANAVPPSLMLLYHSNDLRVYASAEGGSMRFYFAVKHRGVWRAVEGLYNEKLGGVTLRRAERDVVEAIRGAVAKALEKLGRPAKVEEPKEYRDEKGNTKVYYFYLFGHHLAAFLEHAADCVEAGPAEVWLEGRRIVVKAGGVEAEVEFKLLKRKEAEFLLANDVAQTLVLYKSLKEMRVRVEITPRGVRIDSETLWSLIATVVERNTPSVLPAVVMPGVMLSKIHSASGMCMYAFRVSEEGTHYYFAVKTEEGWRAVGGKQSAREVIIAGEAARTIAEAVNAIYGEMGVERKVEVRYDRKGTPYIKLTNVDLELLGLKEP